MGLGMSETCALSLIGRLYKFSEPPGQIRTVIIDDDDDGNSCINCVLMVH